MKKVTKFHTDILQKTHLGQLCGTKNLFRDRYKILRILGRGGFGVTFIARNMDLPGNPLCVIKQLCPRTTNHRSWERAKERFEKEAIALGQLGSHSQIPMLLDFFENRGEFYLVQEYVRGYTLAREVRRDGVKTEAAVKQFLQEILPVLSYIHDRHVIHRDIKPQNILRCKEDGRLVLIDFGAVKDEFIKTKNSTSALQNASTHFVGTMGFAPPEQFYLSPVYASDIYAVGITCVYLLTGKAPLEFEHDPITGEILWQKEANVGEHLGNILSKMIKTSLLERFKSVEEVKRALGLEKYILNLSECMTNKPLGKVKQSQASNFQTPKFQTPKFQNPEFQNPEFQNPEFQASSFQTQGFLSHYSPPVNRTATAIRRWREKLKTSSFSPK